MALVQQKMGGRQGNANYVLYPLAATNPANCNSSSNPDTTNCIFYDTTKGNISMPCPGASPNCSGTGSNIGVLVDSNNNPAWPAAAGYDRATGLGSINVANLVTKWNTVNFTGTTTTLSLGPPTPQSIPHGTAVGVNITVTPNSGAPKPTGAVSLVATPGTNEAGVDGFLLNSNGTVTGATTKFLPGGSYSVFARYGGDGTFGASDSTPAIPVIIGKENSLTFLNLVTFDANFNPIFTANNASVPYGSLYFWRADLTNQADGFQPGPVCSTGCPTGTVTVKDNGVLLHGGTFKLDASLGTTEDLSISTVLHPGAHALTATYSGDNSFNASGPANLSLTITKAATRFSAFNSPGVVTANASFSLTIAVLTGSNAAAPTGTVTFFDGGTAMNGSVTQTPIPGSANGLAELLVTITASLAAVGDHTITATYGGDTNYDGSTTASGTVLTVIPAGSFTAGGSAAVATAGSGANSTITVTPSGGFTGTVAVTCPAATLPPGVSCLPNPLNINVLGSGAATGQLTVNVAPPSAPGTTAELLPATKTEYPSMQGPPTSRTGWWKLSAGTGLAAIFLFFLPGRRRYRATLGLWLICLLSFAIGCGGGGSGGTVPGPTATTTKITAPATKVASGTGLNFNVAITSTLSGMAAGNGTVQLLDGTTVVTTTTAANGVATFTNINSLSVGTHSISAHYLGDSSTGASSSGAVNVAVTGNTTVGILTNPASANSNVTISLTVN